MKLSALKVDAGKVENGAWVDSIPQMEGVRLKVRGTRNSDYRKLQQRLINAVPRKKRAAGNIEPDVQDQIAAQCLLTCCLLDWEGIEDENDQPIPYSKDKAREFLTMPEYRAFLDGVIWAASVVGEEEETEREEAAGNS